VDRQAAVAWAPWVTWASEMVEQDRPDPAFDAMTSRLLRREALRRAAEELNTTSGPGLEDVLARISAEVTAEASARFADLTPPRSHSQKTLRSKV
jgi:phage shock protein A